MKIENFKVLLVYPNHSNVGVVPHNMALLSTCLKKEGIKVKLFDASVYRSEEMTQDDLRTKLNLVKKSNIEDFIKYEKGDVIDGFEKIVNTWKPNLIGMNLVDDTLPLGMKLLERIKKYKIPKIVGGVAVTFGYNNILKQAGVDMACIGEGEKALVELCKKLAKGGDYRHIKNIYYKNSDGTIEKNPIRPLVDINKLPIPDYSIFKNWRFYRPFHGRVVRMAPIDTDRGCPFSCTYCAAPSLKSLYINNGKEKYFREKDINMIMKEIKEIIKKNKINFIWFSSETFFARNDADFEKFAKRYIKEVNLPFWCQTRLDTFTNFKTKLLAKMGCQAVSVGLEHGSEEFRAKVLNKFISNETIISSFRLLGKYKIPATVNNIVGFPDETRKLFFETVKLNRIIYPLRAAESNLNTFIFTPYSGTFLREYCLKKGYLKENKNIISTNFFKTSVLKMPSLSKEEIEGFLRTLPFYIKLPKKYFKDIRIAEKDNKKGKEMFGKLNEVLRKVESETN